MEKKSKRKSLYLTLRNYFITGVVVLIPIGFTLYLSKFLSSAFLKRVFGYFIMIMAVFVFVMEFFVKT